MIEEGVDSTICHFCGCSPVKYECIECGLHAYFCDSGCHKIFHENPARIKHKSRVITDETPPCCVCKAILSTIKCGECLKYFCNKCDNLFHKKKARIGHKRTSVAIKAPTPECFFCDNASQWKCEECSKHFCNECDETFHSENGTKTHTRTTVGFEEINETAEETNTDVERNEQSPNLETKDDKLLHEDQLLRNTILEKEQQKNADTSTMNELNDDNKNNSEEKIILRSHRRLTARIGNAHSQLFENDNAEAKEKEELAKRALLAGFSEKEFETALEICKESRRDPLVYLRFTWTANLQKLISDSSLAGIDIESVKEALIVSKGKITLALDHLTKKPDAAKESESSDSSSSDCSDKYPSIGINDDLEQISKGKYDIGNENTMTVNTAEINLCVPQKYYEPHDFDEREISIFNNLTAMGFSEKQSILATKVSSDTEEAVGNISDSFSCNIGKCNLEGNLDEDDMVIYLRCKHRSCKTCAIDYFQNQLEEDLDTLVCPLCGEPKNLEDETIAQKYFPHLRLLLQELGDEDLKNMFEENFDPAYFEV